MALARLPWWAVLRHHAATATKSSRLPGKATTVGAKALVRGMVTTGHTSGHVPVMASQAISLWMGDKEGAGGVFVDGTAGLGGHTRLLLDRDSTAHVIGVDRDPEVCAECRVLCEAYGARAAIVHGNYGELRQVLTAHGHDSRVDGVLLDVGVNSLHLDSAERGFSFMHDGPLDMRFDRTSTGPNASDVVNFMPEAQLAKVFWEFGEERHSRAAAAAIVERRAVRRFGTTFDLAQVVARAVSPRTGGRRNSKRHPATKCFQALRIVVNQELQWLKAGIAECVEALDEGGVLAVITFHSLEARMVKHAFRSLEDAGMGVRSPRKALLPTEAEALSNPRARSATLRGFRRARETASGTSRRRSGRHTH